MLGGKMLTPRSVIQSKHLNTILYISLSSLSRGHQNSNNDSLLLLFDGLWKVKTDYMVEEDKHNIFYFFLLKMFKLLRILFIMTF